MPLRRLLGPWCRVATAGLIRASGSVRQTNSSVRLPTPAALVHGILPERWYKQIPVVKEPRETPERKYDGRKMESGEERPGTQ